MNKYKKDTLICVFFLLISCLLSLIFFKCPFWDFYSYHYYNGWAFLNNRLNIDFMPCLFRTYFNPILDSIMYVTIEILNNHPLLFIMLSGLKYGILMFIAYKIYDFVFKKSENNIISTLFCIITAGASPIILFCIGFDNMDLQCANIILIGFYLYIKNIFSIDCKKRNILLFIATFLAGISIGLKYVNISSGIAFLLTTILMYKKIEKPIKTLCIVTFGLFWGFILVDGFWLFLIYKMFNNPLFPYFNNIFHSDFANTNSVLSADFNHLLPKSLIDFITYPFKNPAIHLFSGFDCKYYYMTIPCGFISILVLIFALKNNNFIKQIKINVDSKILILLLLYTVTIYYTNLILFANLRYVLSLFIIMPIFICILIQIISKKEFYLYSILFVLFIYAFTYQIFEGYKPQIKNLFHLNNIVEITNMHFENNSTVICGTLLSCFIAPNQNPMAKYIGFSLPQDLANIGLKKETNNLKNHYYTNKYLEKEITQILEKEKNVYFIVAIGGMLDASKDINLYKQALNKYSKDKIKLKNCKKIDYYVFYKRNSMGNVYACKIK